MKLTADTITDEQIRELLTLVTALAMDETDDSSAMRAAKRYRARARCAEILNARAKAGAP